MSGRQGKKQGRLSLTRNIGESIQITVNEDIKAGDTIKITYLGNRYGSNASLSLEGPRCFGIVRSELLGTPKQTAA